VQERVGALAFEILRQNEKSHPWVAFEVEPEGVPSVFPKASVVQIQLSRLKTALVP